jgi:hypothetical protein
MPKRAFEEENRVPASNESSLIRVFLNKVKSFFAGLWNLISSWFNKPNRTPSKVAVEVEEPVSMAVQEETPKPPIESEVEIERTELVETKPTENTQEPQELQEAQKVEEPSKKMEPVPVVVDALWEEAQRAQLKIEEDNKRKRNEQREAEEQQAAEKKKYQEMRKHAIVIACDDVSLSYFLTQNERQRLEKPIRNEVNLSKELDLISDMSTQLAESLRTLARKLLAEAQQLQEEKGNDNALKKQIKSLEWISKRLNEGIEVPLLFEYRMKISSDGHNIIAFGPPNPGFYIGNLITDMLQIRAELAMAVDNLSIPTKDQIEASRQEAQKLVEKIANDPKLLNYTDLDTIPLRIELAILNRASRFTIKEPSMYFVMTKQMSKIQEMLNKPSEAPSKPKP